MSYPTISLYADKMAKGIPGLLTSMDRPIVRTKKAGADINFGSPLFIKDSVKGVYTLAISTALAAGDTLKIASEGKTAEVSYAYDAGATTASTQATAIAALFAADTVFDVTASTSNVVFTQKIPLVGSAPVASVTASSAPTGVVAVTETTAGFLSRETSVVTSYASGTAAFAGIAIFQDKPLGHYAAGEAVNCLTHGSVYVTAGVHVEVGKPVYVRKATGVFVASTESGAAVELSYATYQGNAEAGELVEIRLK